MRDVDDAGRRADARDHPVADADEVIDQAVVGEERDDRGPHARSAASATSASITPSMSCRAASTWGSRPCSRRVALVTGPMLTNRARSGTRPPGGEEERDGRGGGERDVVGRRPAPACSALAERLGHRLIQRHHVDLRPALAQRVGQHVAGLGRAGHQRARHRHVGQRLPPGSRPRTARARRRRSRRARAGPARCPGPIAATRAPASARASRPPRGHALEQQPHAVGAGQADQVVAPQIGSGTVERHDPDGRSLDRPERRARAAGRPARWPGRGRG